MPAVSLGERNISECKSPSHPFLKAINIKGDGKDKKTGEGAKDILALMQRITKLLSLPLLGAGHSRYPREWRGGIEKLPAQLCKEHTKATDTEDERRAF